MLMTMFAAMLTQDFATPGAAETEVVERGCSPSTRACSAAARELSAANHRTIGPGPDGQI